MLKYLYRTCPKCGDYLGVVVWDPPEPMREVPIDAHCVVCGFRLLWRVVKGGKSLPIIPGMVASVDILTGHKTVLDYLLKPVLRARNRALRER